MSITDFEEEVGDERYYLKDFTPESLDDILSGVVTLGQETFYKKELQCTGGRNRSVIDYCRIVLSYFPELTILEILNHLVLRASEDVVRIFYCNDIAKVVLTINYKGNVDFKRGIYKYSHPGLMKFLRELQDNK